MSCGTCGTDAPHGEKEGADKEECMACKCPCDEHKEHNHEVKEGGGEEHNH